MSQPSHATPRATQPNVRSTIRAPRQLQTTRTQAFLPCRVMRRSRRTKAQRSSARLIAFRAGPITCPSRQLAADAVALLPEQLAKLAGLGNVEHGDGRMVDQAAGIDAPCDRIPELDQVRLLFPCRQRWRSVYLPPAGGPRRGMVRRGGMECQKSYGPSPSPPWPIGMRSSPVRAPKPGGFGTGVVMVPPNSPLAVVEGEVFGTGLVRGSRASTGPKRVAGRRLSSGPLRPDVVRHAWAQGEPVPFTPAASSRFGPPAGPGPDSAGLNDLAIRRLLGLETN